MSYTNILYLYMSGILDRMRMVVTPIPPKEFRVKLNKIPTIKMAPVQMTDRTAFMDKIGKPRLNKPIVETRIPPVIEGEPAATEEPEEPGQVEAGPEEPGPEEPGPAESVEKIKIKTKRAYVKKKGVDEPIVADGEEKAPEKIKIKTKRAYVKKKEVDEPIVADEGDKSPERIKIKVKRLKKPIAKKMSSQLIIGVDSISERIGPLSDELRVETSNYYLNNREIFNNFMMSLYEPYKEELIEDARIGQSCDRSDDGLFTISTHQKIVRDYLNIHAPYRGILLYHGLGSG
jgi:nitrogen fixation protein